MSKVILGIDPGQTGALVWVKNGVVTQCLDMPTMAKLTGKGNTVSPILVYHLISATLPDVVYIEKVHSMPKQGVASSFEFGFGLGILHGVVASCSLKMHLVTPQAWKKHHALLKKEKDAARSLAISTHPEAAALLARKKDIGRADAMLIADYGEALEYGRTL